MLPSQREQFDVPRDICYLNAASYSPLPRRTLEAGRAAVGRKGQPWLVPGHFANAIHERTRTAAARLINADADDVADGRDWDRQDVAEDAAACNKVGRAAGVQDEMEWVVNKRGRRESASIFRRMFFTCASMARSNDSTSVPRTASRSCARVNTRPGRRASAAVS